MINANFVCAPMFCRKATINNFCSQEAKYFVWPCCCYPLSFGVIFIDSIAFHVRSQSQGQSAILEIWSYTTNSDVAQGHVWRHVRVHGESGECWAGGCEIDDAGYGDGHKAGRYRDHGLTICDIVECVMIGKVCINIVIWLFKNDFIDCQSDVMMNLKLDF